MNARRPMDAVVVVGGGLTALCAAIAYARALPRAQVTLAVTPIDPAALADRLPAVTPPVAATFDTLGIDPRMLVAASAATHRVGERFDWGTPPFAIGEGEGVPAIAGTALHQLWLAHGDGAYDALVPGAALASAERFVLPTQDPRSLLSRTDYTLRLDADRATPLLAQAAQAARVRVVRASALSVTAGPDGIAAIDADGTRLTADLYIDASGPTAMLAPPGAEWIDWRETLPADRLLLGSAAAAPSPTDRYERHAIGWTAHWPLATRTLSALAWRASATGDATARKQMPGEAELIAVQPRRRAAPFAGNVLALGDAAAAVGPLGWMGFALALAQLAVALELMPSAQPEPGLIAEYNRRATLRADRVHAYLAAFHLAAPARTGGFWHPLRKVTPPAELATALAQFGQRGSLPPVEEEIIPKSQWRQALIGLGIRPARLDPIALSVPAAQAKAALGQLRDAVAMLPAALPPYPDYLTMSKRGGR
ncbi:MAG: tryptophan 7-halogenase [Sphingomonas sp.]